MSLPPKQTLRECRHIDEVVWMLGAKGLTGYAAEVGAYLGRTAVKLFETFDLVYLVDLWPHNGDEDFEECKRKLSPYRDRSIFLRGLSWEMAGHIPDESLDYVYIDCDHEYPSVVKDLAAYYPKLRSGVGAVASGHDYGDAFPGVKQAVDEFAAANSLSLNADLGCSDSWAFEKE